MHRPARMPSSVIRHYFRAFADLRSHPSWITANRRTTIMKVGTIGAGAIAQAIAVRLVAAGVEDIILSNSRGPHTLTTLVSRLGGNTRAGTAAEATDADLVILSVPWS